LDFALSCGGCGDAAHVLQVSVAALTTLGVSQDLRKPLDQSAILEQVYKVGNKEYP
jgi:hypothetical protein